MAIAVDVRVTGRVQGVFFRARTREEAQRLGVTGWVRNEPDGSVRVHVEGEPQAVEALVAWCHHGPPRARVEDVRTQPAEVAGAAHFTVRE